MYGEAQLSLIWSAEEAMLRGAVTSARRGWLPHVTSREEMAQALHIGSESVSLACDHETGGNEYYKDQATG
jgi:hypothetical protein